MNKKKILMSIVGLLIIAIGLSSAYYMTIADKDNSVDTSTVSDKTENVNKYQDIKYEIKNGLLYIHLFKKEIEKPQIKITKM